MKTLLLTMKGLMFWITFINVLAYIMGGAISLAEIGCWWFLILWTISIFILIHLCRRYISLKEIYILSGARFFDKIFE